MAANECDLHRKSPLRCVLVAVLIIFILILFLLLITWLIFRPTKPHFTLQNLTIFAFNLSSTNFLTTNLQITVSSRNPNSKIVIHYDEISAYAAYRGRRITLPTQIPATYQGNKETVVWSPFLYGNQIPVTADLGVALKQDEMAGTVLVSVKLVGWIRWKVGTVVTGRFRLTVKCPVYLNFGGRKTNGIAVGTATFQNQLILACHVDI